MDEFNDLFCKQTQAFKQGRTLERARQLALGLFNCMGRHTLTGMITGLGHQFKDWTAAYRLFQADRMKVSALFHGVLKEILSSHLATDQAVSVHLDDTLLRKTGKKVADTRWLRDPLGPAFHTNFVWSQRFVQLSMSCPLPDKSGAARCVPVNLKACPPVKKPGKDASIKQLADFKDRQKKQKLSQLGVEAMIQFREQLDQLGAVHRNMIISVDGSYTNDTVIKQLPSDGRITLIGRIRKDCKLHKLPEFSKVVGRNRVYGDQLPTPEQIRKDETTPWIKVKAWAAGKEHDFKVKVVKPVRWRKAGPMNLQVVVIKPLAYRLTKKSDLLYRQPAYLICTDVHLPINLLLQNYLWRWGIEVNFREEKTNLGCGQAQVRTAEAVTKVPAFIVACYAMMLLAAMKVEKRENIKALPRPKWYPRSKPKKITTGDRLNEIRSQIYLNYIGINFSHFVKLQQTYTKSKKFMNPLLSAQFYYRN